MNHVLSNLTSGLFQLQKTIESQEDTIVNLTNQYSQVQQEIRTKLKKEQRVANNPRPNYVPKIIPRIRSQKQQNFLFISSFFLGIFTVLILLLLIMILSSPI